jgi:hypothetical protein
MSPNFYRDVDDTTFYYLLLSIAEQILLANTVFSQYTVHEQYYGARKNPYSYSNFINLSPAVKQSAIVLTEEIVRAV